MYTATYEYAYRRVHEYQNGRDRSSVLMWYIHPYIGPYAPINVMPQYPPYGQNTGHIRGTDEKSVPHTGDFDIQVYAHTHMR